MQSKIRQKPPIFPSCFGSHKPWGGLDRSRGGVHRTWGKPHTAGVERRG
jgi:hypothetical protein